MSSLHPSRRHLLLGAVLILSGIASQAAAQASSTVRFARGNDNTSVDGKIRGDAWHDYLLGAKAGQKMSVSLITSGGASFNILPPGSTGEAIFIGSVEGNDAVNVPLPKSGNYTIRVYQLGAAADQGKVTSFTLSMGIN